MDQPAPPAPAAPDGPRRPRRTQAERRAASQARLLAAAARLIAERGTTAVGFGEIAKAAGVSHGLPSYLFGTKAGLLRALVDSFAVQIVDDILRPAVGDVRGPAALRMTLGMLVESLRDPWPEARALNILLGEALGNDAELRAAVNRYNATLRRLVAEWIRQGVEDGDIRAPVDPEAQATLWVAVVRGLSYQAITDPDATSMDALIAELSATVERVFAIPPGDTP